VTRSNGPGQTAGLRHRLNPASPLPPQKVIITVVENKVQLIDIICAELVNKELCGHHKLVITGKDSKPVEVAKDICRERLDLETFHEETDVIMVLQMARLAQSGVRSISVMSVFVLLMPYYADLRLTCNLTMKAPDGY